MPSAREQPEARPPTQFLLAACYEKIGRAASAWITYQDVAAAAASAGKTSWAERATANATALEGRLARLTITTNAGPAGLQVRRDGHEVAAGEFAVALPLDPRDHVIEASAPNKNTSSD